MEIKKKEKKSDFFAKRSKMKAGGFREWCVGGLSQAICDAGSPSLGVAALFFFTGCWHGKWEIRINFVPDENPRWQVWWDFKGKVTSGQPNVTGNTHYQRRLNAGGSCLNLGSPSSLSLEPMNVSPPPQKKSWYGEKDRGSSCFILPWVHLAVVTYFSSYYTNPFVCISYYHIPKHSITGVFCTSHSCLQDVIPVIFCSLALFQG